MTDNATPEVSLATKLQVILSYGFVLTARNWKVNPGHPGHYMVIEEDDPSITDAWAVVGDRVEDLIDEAFNACAFYSHFDAVLADVLAGGVGILHSDGMGAVESLNKHETEG